MNKLLISGAAATTIMVASGCADPFWRTAGGAVAGAAVGAVVGKQVGDEKGAYIGAVLGGIAGGSVGYYMDKQQRELEQQLAAERARKELNIQRLSDGSLKIGIAGSASFDTNSSQMRPEFLSVYEKIANTLKGYEKTVIHVVGHTDDRGSYDLNQKLSESRASSVYQYFNNLGITTQRMQAEGRAYQEPIAPNATSEGRARNRRVDVVIRPLVEGRETEAYQRPPYLGA